MSSSSRSRTGHDRTQSKAITTKVGQRILWALFCFSYGIFNLLLYLAIALSRGQFKTRKTEREELQFAIARDRFWNLSKQPVAGFRHAFHTTRTGLKLHYITNEGNGNGKHSGNLFILLHGFPDTSVTWRYLLQEPAAPVHGATIVCVDLPGFGGSDGLPKSNTDVLEALTDFIVATKERHVQTRSSPSEANTIIVAHDWGCAIAFRLAAEASILADRFLLTNGPHVGLALSNKDRMLKTAERIVKQSNYSFSGFLKAYRGLKPLLSQVLMFGYIFAFNLPLFLVSFLGTGGSQVFLRAVLRRAHGESAEAWNAQEALAATTGPGTIEVDTKTSSGDTYGLTVRERAASAGKTFISMTAYYRDGLAFGTWEKSLETVADLYNLEAEHSSEPSPIRRRSSSSASSFLFSETYEGSLKTPATILWGEKDLAITKAVCLDGIGDYLAKGSEVILLPRTGHWGQVEKESRAAFAKAIQLYNAAELPLYISNDLKEVYNGISVMVKR